MACREISLSGNISAASVSGSLNAYTGMSGSLNMAERVYEKEVEFDNRFEFPSIGNDNMLYVAKDEHKIYIFDTNNLNYVVVGSDYSEIEMIQGIL